MMKWMNGFPRIWQSSVLGLLLVALMGPWVFDRIYMPAQYACPAPIIRLEGDFCGVPLSGLKILGTMGLAVFGLLGEAITLPEAGRAFLILAVLGLPLISTAGILLRGKRRPWLGFQLATFGLTAGMLLLSGLFTDFNQSLVLWGPWLYLAVAGVTLLLEGAGLAARSRHNALVMN